MTPQQAHAEAVRRIRAAGENGDSVLDLGDLPLVALPAEIGELRHLRVLALGKSTPTTKDGKIQWAWNSHRPASVADLEPLERLASLRSLDLSGCKNVAGLEPLRGLSALSMLRLSYCERAEGLEPLRGLACLSELDLTFCKRVASLEALSGLSSLARLDLSGCTSVESLEPLRGLSSLAWLNLPSWGMSEASLEPLSSLPSLTTLNLAFCPEIAGLEPLGRLSSLASLAISGCRRVVSLQPLRALRSLSFLNMENCPGVRDLEPLRDLASLNWLNLRACWGVESLVPLQGLSSLSSLNLARLRGLAFAPVRPLLHRLDRLVLCQSDFLDLPDDLCGQENENVIAAVRAYHDDLGADPVGDSEAKVFVLGNGHVGKTQLVRRLVGQAYDPAIPSTHGAQLGQMLLPMPDIEAPARLNLWDFGGQDIYLGSHALFLQGRAVFLVLWASGHEDRAYEEAGFSIRDRPLAYWLDYLSELAGACRPDGTLVMESPVLLIQGRCESKSDEREPPVLPDPARFPNVWRLSFSARRDRNFGTLRDSLAEAVGLLAQRRKEPLIGKGRAAVRARLREMQAAPTDANRTVSVPEFERMCAEAGNISSPREFLKSLARSGVVYHREGLFGDRVIVDQTWAMEAVYAVIRRRADLQDAIRANHGRFTRETLARHVWAEFGLEEQQAFLGLMRQCHVCFSVGPGQYVAPELLPEWDGHRERRFHELLRQPDAVVTLRYGFLHDGVLRGFLSRIGSRAGEHAEFWKYGCWFHDEATGSAALARATRSPDPKSGAGAIELRARGPGAKPLLRALVAAAHSPIGQPPAIDPPDFIDDRPAEGEPLADLRISWPRRTAFVSYNHAEGRSLLDGLVPALERVAGQRDRVVWDDQLPDDGSISRFVECARTRPGVVALIGPRYLRSRYCMQELFAAWESSGCDRERFAARVLPVFLDGADCDDAGSRSRHAQHWRGLADQLAPAAGAGTLASADYDLFKQMRDWGQWLGDALAALADPKLPRGWEAASADGFRVLLQVAEERFRRLGVQ